MNTESISCPRCECALESSLIQEVDAEVEALCCVGCGGLLFRAGQLEPLTVVHKPTLVEIRHIPSAKLQAKALYCPVCPSLPRMDKVEHERDRKVVVDICPSCRGTWLDRGELEAIQKESLLVFLADNIRWFAGLFRQ